jgi:hypothetical protein
MDDVDPPHPDRPDVKISLPNRTRKEAIAAAAAVINAINARRGERCEEAAVDEDG